MPDPLHIHLSDQTRGLVINALHNAHGPCRDEVARYHPDRCPGHGRVGEPLTEGRFNLIAQLTRRLLGTVERHLIGDSRSIGVLGLMALGQELLIDLGSEAVNQNDLHPHALNQRQVLGQGLKFSGLDGLTRDGHHKGLAPVHVDVGCNRSEPGHKSEIKDQRHRA